jgi:hypothetical protein
MAETVKTGEKCKVSGDYKCQTHDSSRIPLAINNVAPPCRYGGNSHGTTWVMYDKV